MRHYLATSSIIDKKPKITIINFLHILGVHCSDCHKEEIFHETPVLLTILERLSITFTANGKQ